MTALITIFTLAVGGTGTWAAVGLIDELHTTEAELLLYDLKAHTFASNQFAGLEEKIIAIEVTSKCQWLRSQIRALEDSIYVRERDGADADYINELQKDLDSLEDDYDALECAKKLA